MGGTLLLYGTQEKGCTNHSFIRSLFCTRELLGACLPTSMHNCQHVPRCSMWQDFTGSY
jgi:hypothetical protein